MPGVRKRLENCIRTPAHAHDNGVLRLHGACSPGKPRGSPQTGPTLPQCNNSTIALENALNRIDDPLHDHEVGSADSTLDTTRIDDVRIGAVRPLISPALL